MIITRGLGSNLLVTRGYGGAIGEFIKIVSLVINDFIKQVIKVKCK